MKQVPISAILLLLVLNTVGAEAQTPHFATLVTYNGLTQYGRNNRDSVLRALARLGITGFDTLDRNSYGSASIDYTPWCTVIWCSGDPSIPVAPGEATGQSGLSLKEVEEIERYLQAGLTYWKKSLVMAGQNIAYEHTIAAPNGISVDTTFLQSAMHVRYVSNSPTGGAYSGPIIGGYSDYWQFYDELRAGSPNVIRPANTTPLVGPEVNWYAYSYEKHSNTPTDSGAGITYYSPTINTIFYALDWADPIQSNPGEVGVLTSGITRVLKGGLDFLVSHGQNCILADVEEPSGELKFDLRPEIFSSPGQATISFTIPVRARAAVQLFDFNGKMVRTMFSDQCLDPGQFHRSVNLSGISNGAYFFELTATDERWRTVRLSRKAEIQR